jgi:hypothetical protein
VRPRGLEVGSNNSREEEVIIMGTITMDGITKIAAVEVTEEVVEVTTVATGAGPELYTLYVELMYAS